MKPKGKPMQFLKNFRNNQSGATAIEYGLLAALLAVAAILALSTVSEKPSDQQPPPEQSLGS